jgi:hypothetical protein
MYIDVHHLGAGKATAKEGIQETYNEMGYRFDANDDQETSGKKESMH